MASDSPINPANIQKPKGTRDFYPALMAWRNHLVDTWRKVSIRNGFEQVDGPIFETLDLYKVKSGDGIVSELFSFCRAGGSTDYAIRPEFTPTLARMVAAQANSLPKPIKWFTTPNLCRAEKHQRGRLREFLQWNVDVLGSDAAIADTETIFTAIDFLAEMGLRPDQVRVKISHRQTVRHILIKLGVPEEKLQDAFGLLDRRDKLEPAKFTQGAAALGLDDERVQRFDQICRMKYRVGDLDALREQIGIGDELTDIETLDQQLVSFGVADWCEYDLGIVRGLAYYTGAVYEIHEATGVERALAGGGRYDNLIELFGGPRTPAVGFGMGDVVLANVLEDKGLLPADVSPTPDVFIVAVTDAGATQVPAVTAQLRRAGLHTRFSYKATRNMGKLMKEAANTKSNFTIILGDEVNDGVAAVKDMQTQAQEQVAISTIASHIIGG